MSNASHKSNRKHKSSPKWVTERLSIIILVEYSLFDLTVLNHEIIVLVTFFLSVFTIICSNLWVLSHNPYWINCKTKILTDEIINIYFNLKLGSNLGIFSFSYFLVIKHIDTWINSSMYVFVTHSHVLYMHMKVCVYTYTSMNVRMYV